MFAVSGLAGCAIGFVLHAPMEAFLMAWAFGRVARWGVAETARFQAMYDQQQQMKAEQQLQ